MSQVTEAPISTPNVSTVIDQGDNGTPLGGGQRTQVEPESTEHVKGESIRDTLSKTLKEIQNNDAQEPESTDEEKPAKEAKAKAKPEKVEAEKVEDKQQAKRQQERQAKELKAQESAESDSDEDADTNPAEKPVRSERDGDERQDRQSGGRERPEPPARFLPKAKEVWRNVPQAVQSEVSRMVQDHEQEVSRYRESHQFREELREYEDLGRSHNTTVKEALGNYVNLERTLHSNPGAGFKQILSNMGMSPNEAIGHIMQAYGVDPRKVGQHMAQAPNEYAPRQRQQAPMPQPPQDDARVRQLEQTIYSMQQQQASKDIIEPFAEANPRYYELENDIAFFLHSGKVPHSLPPAERLAVAYDMAERQNPSSNVGYSDEPESRVDSDSNGRKSVKSAPGNLSNRAEPEKKLSTREVLENEFKRMRKS